MGLPKARNIEAAERLFDGLTGWQLANDTISTYFDKNHANVEASIVVVKVVLISSLYYARIFEPLKMAVHIAGLQGLDSELKNGDTKAVERIAHLDRYEVSFASKYAHFHNGDAFPILDNFASGAVAILLGKSFNYTYPDFYNNISLLRQKSGLNSTDWRSFDKYLWLYGQKKKSLDKGISVNNEVTALYESTEGKILFDALEP
ncbi:hypothetical protein ACFLVN_03300 [Chloroflexota bacterium]